MKRTRYPYALPTANPSDGESWTLSNRHLRELMAHCHSLPVFMPPIRGWHFICAADRLLRDYRADAAAASKRKAWPPRRTLKEFAAHAEGLARAVERLGGIDAATGYPDTAGMLRKTARGPDLPPLDPAVLRAMATNARAASAVLAAGSKPGAPQSAGPRRILIRRLRAAWHVATKTAATDKPTTEFLESLALLLSHAGTRRALQAQVRRALTAR